MSLLDTHRATSLWGAFERTAAEAADRTAVTTTQGSTTFGRVRELADRLSVALAAHGITSGTVVHLVLPSSTLFLPSLLAVRRRGAAVGLVSARYRDAELRAVQERMPPSAYLTTSRLATLLTRALEVTDVHEITVSEDEEPLALVRTRQRPDGPDPARLSEDLALVKFTSGSTGAPKGVGLTEAQLLAEAGNVVATLGIRPGDRILVPVPVSHSYGFDLGLLPVVTVGAAAVLRASFIPRQVLADLADPATSVFLGVPSMYRVLAETDPAAVPDLSHVRHLLSCTAPLLPDLIDLCHERLGVRVCQHYGSSETGAAANHRRADVLDRPGSVGVAVSGVEIQVVDDDGVAQPPGAEGEIVIRSRAVSSGYVTDEGAAAAAFHRVADGVNEYRTGDIGAIDEDGFVHWRGRKDQVINVGGLKVYPSEVQQVLERCPEVSGARVVGASDPRGEQVVHAVVTLARSTRPQDILAFCRQHLADYKVPRRIEVVESISSPETAKMNVLSGEAP